MRNVLLIIEIHPGAALSCELGVALCNPVNFL
ncbi:hypothetical protein HCH_00306 [Hahella chejuensis KCTC 2396]|uniref:Uncharacterized protein n=1 Tax=Hahella chejuensis (strain KCTC 2396) TaxID=349521 RepID=Q2SQ56_HAHCH|nr:hypothetical protein HCH_00306 [Hahella chejuensis KCTC 2396]